MDSRWTGSVIAALTIGGTASIGGAASGLAEAAQPAASARTGLIPRAAIFGNPERAQARLSPDGRFVSFLAPRNGVLNVYVAPRDGLAQAQPITEDKLRGIREHFWALDGRHV